MLRSRGAIITRLTLPVMDAVATYGSIVSRVEAATIHAEWMRSDPQAYGAHISGRMYPGYAIPAPYYVGEGASRRGPVRCGRVCSRRVCAKVDVLPWLRPRFGLVCRRWRRPTSIMVHWGPKRSSWRSRPQYAAVQLSCGLPAISVPASWRFRSGERLPNRLANRRTSVRGGACDASRRYFAYQRDN